MLHLFRIALAMLLLGSLSACMKPSDLADGADYYLRDAGVLDHSASQRSNNRRIQADSFIYIGQGPFVPPGYRYARPNVVAEQAFEGFVEYFPLVRRAKAPLGLDDAMREARAAGAHYLLYCRFARGDNRIGNWEEWEDEEELGRVGRDRSVIQVMLIETSTRFLGGQCDHSQPRRFPDVLRRHPGRPAASAAGAIRPGIAGPEQSRNRL